MLIERVTKLWPVGLLLAIAVVHAFRVTARDQTPWKGGGFGMFSTLDGHKNRFARLYAIVPGQDRMPVALQPEFKELVERFVMAPGETAAANCLSQLSELRFRQTKDDTLSASKTVVGSQFESDVEVTGLELEYWTIDFDRNTETMTSRMVERFEATVAGRQQ